MNILFINFSFTVGGAAYTSTELAESLTKKGLNVKYFSSAGLNDFPVKETFSRRIIRNIFWRPFQESGIADFNFPMKMPASLKSAVDWADCVHLHNLHGGFFNLSWLKKISSQKKIFWSIHDEWVLTGHCAYPMECGKWRSGCGNCPKKRTFPKISIDTTSTVHRQKHEMLNDTDINLIFSSEWMMQKAIDAGITKNLKKIDYGINNEWFNQFRKSQLKSKLELDDNTRYLIVALNEENKFKGGELLKQVLPKVTKNHPLHLIAVGDISNGYFDTSEIPVTYTGKLDLENFRNYLRAADILLLPSIADSSPLIVKQAMATETAVIAFSVGGVSEMLDNGRGILVEPMNVSEFVDKLNSLVCDFTKVKIQEKAKNYAQENYTVDRYSESHIALYKKVVD